jgi:filamentous hemagglutinin
MNKRCYRIVFNPARAQLMAVAETACAHSGGAPGQSQAKRIACLPGLAAHGMGLGRLRALVVAMAAGLGLAAPLQAQIIADPSAPATQRPTILSDGAGRPLVNIQTPSSAGVSRNTYSQFDVQSNGAVLNNSRASNPWLATGEARVILNEVNSSNPSYLRGAVSVKGSSAQVVIANPSGLKIDGASFVNASRVTLTTGTAVMEGGGLKALRVERGALDIYGAGLNVQGVPYTEILSRAATLSAKVRASAAGDISIITGAQSVDYATGQSTSLSASSPAPALAIDASALGSMYAGRITLLATEAGVGVRNAGALQAASQLILTADGQLSNSGSLSAPVVSLGTVNGGIAQSGKVQATNTLILSAGGDALLSGKGMAQVAGSTVVVSSQKSLVLKDNATVSSTATGGQVYLSARESVQLGTGSTVAAQGDVSISSDKQVQASGVKIKSEAKAIMLAGEGLSMNNSSIVASDIHLETGKAFTATNSPIRLSGNTFRASRDAGRTLTILASGSLESTSNSYGVEGHLHLGAAQELNSQNDGLDGFSIELIGKSISASGMIAGAQIGSLKISSSAGAVDIRGTSNRLSQLYARDDVEITALGGDARLSALAATSVFGSIRVNASGDTRLSGLDVMPARIYGDSFDWGVLLDANHVSLATVGAGKTLDLGRALFRVGYDINLTSAGSISARDAYINAIGGSVSMVSAGEIELGSGSSFIRAGGESLTIDAGQGDVVISRAMSDRFSGQDISIIARRGTLRFDGQGGNNTSDLSRVRLYGRDMWLQGRSVVLLGASLDAARDLRIIATDAGLNINPLESVYGEGDYISRYSTFAELTAGRDLKLVAAGGINVRSFGGADFFYSPSSSSQVTPAATGDFGILRAGQNLSIDAGKGNLLISPWQSDRLSAGQDISIIARAGQLKLDGQPGASPLGASRVSMAARDLTLQGTAIELLGSSLNASRDLRITATDGSVTIHALENTVPEGGYTNRYMQGAELNAGNNLHIFSAGNISAQGLQASAGAELSIQALGGLLLTGTSKRLTEFDGFWTTNQRLVNAGTLTAGGAMALSAGTDLLTDAIKARAGGAMTLNALGNVRLDASQNWKEMTAVSSSTSETWYGSETTTVTHHLRESITTEPTELSAASVSVKAGNDLSTYGTRMDSQGQVILQADGAATYYAVYDQVNNRDDSHKTSSWLGMRYSSSNSTSSRVENTPLVTRLQSQAELVSNSGGDTLLQGTQVRAGGGYAISAGVGDAARADARIILEGVKTTVQESKTAKSDYVVWQSMSGSGSTTQTMALPSFAGGGTFSATGGITVQIPDGDFKSQIQTLSAQPGMAYLNDLAARKDVNWEPVKLAHDEWSYSQSGLTPAGAALLAVAVAWATGGVGADLIGGTVTTTTTTAAGVTTATTVTTTAGMMANAAFTSLATQASITLVNNKGDIGKTLKDLSNSSTIKAALAAALTAGVIDKLGATSTMSGLRDTGQFADKLTYNLINATGRALTTTAINGGDLQDALKAAIVGGLVDTAQGQAASLIKGLEGEYLAHKLAHALVGCVAGAAAGGACKDGAIGGAVGEMVAEMFKDQRPGLFASDAEKQSFNAKVLATSKLVSGAVSAYAGGNAQTAITTAEAAVSNNFLIYNRSNSRASQWGSFKQELDSCKVTAGCDVGGVYSRWTAISNEQQRQAMGSMDALFAANPSEASTAGQWFGKAVSSMYMDPRDVCAASDTRCISFVQTQQNQARAVYASGLSIAYSNDLIDGGGRLRSSLLEAPVPTSKLTNKVDSKVGAFGTSINWSSWGDYPKVTLDGKQYAQVGERLYSQHAVDRMQPSGFGIPAGSDALGRNTPPNIVDYVIRTGEKTAVTTAEGVPRTVHWSGNVGVVTENGGKIVVTVLRRGS